MKNKLTIFGLVMVCIAFIALVGCESKEDSSSKGKLDSKYVGDWEAYKAMFKGEEQDINEVLDGGEYTLDLDEDGTAEVTYEGETNKGNWFTTKSGIKIEGDGLNMKLKATDDNKLTIKLVGMTIYFEKDSDDDDDVDYAYDNDDNEDDD